MKTKPPIFITKNDPFASPAALHFERVSILPLLVELDHRITASTTQFSYCTFPIWQLFHKYGHPIIALNLVKKKEKRARESKLAIALT